MKILITVLLLVSGVASAKAESRELRALPARPGGELVVVQNRHYLFYGEGPGHWWLPRPEAHHGEYVTFEIPSSQSSAEVTFMAPFGTSIDGVPAVSMSSGEIIVLYGLDSILIPEIADAPQWRIYRGNPRTLKDYPKPLGEDAPCPSMR